MENIVVTKPLGKARLCPSKMEVLFKKVVQEGDYIAYRELFTRYYRSLCTYSMRVVVAREVAEEVVADVFVKLWKNREQIEVHTSFEAYIFRAVRNQSLDYLKLKLHRVHEREPLESIQWNLAYADHYTPAEEIVFNEFYDRVEGHINDLPPAVPAYFPHESRRRPSVS